MHLRRARSLQNVELVPLNPKIERWCREVRANQRRDRMAENLRQQNDHGEEARMGQLPRDDIGNQMLMRINLRDIQRPVIGTSPSCIRLSAAARNYELKNIHFSMLPSFHGLPSEDPLTFVREFYTTIQTFPLNGLTEDELRMRCFPYTLKDRAKMWFINLLEGSLAN